MNKHYGKAPDNFNQDDVKEIDNKYIGLSNEDLIEENKINIYII